MSENFLFLFVFFVFGAVVGSFLNVCIYRIPEGGSVVTPPSACPNCSHEIRWYENIPLVSFVFLRGRCSSCCARIPLRYPMVEALSGVVFALVFDTFGFSWSTFCFLVFSALLLVVTFIDLDHQVVPDVISLPGIAVGFTFSFLVPWVGWLDSFLGILLGGGILLIIACCYELLAKSEGMGGGDIKLLAMIGAFLGWKAIFPVIFFSSLAGTVAGVPLMLLSPRRGKVAIPFGPFLSLGALVYLFWGPKILRWYFSLYSP